MKAGETKRNAESGKLKVESGTLARGKSAFRFPLSAFRSPPLVIVVLALVFGGGWFWVWQTVKADVLAGPAYRLTPDAVQITPVPEWIHKQPRDICREVFRDASLDPPLSILDEGLVERIRGAPALEPLGVQGQFRPQVPSGGGESRSRLPPAGLRGPDRRGSDSRGCRRGVAAG